MKNLYKEKYINCFVWGLYIVTMGYVLFCPQDSVNSALGGCSLFVQSILPTLFPFFVLSSFAVNSGMDKPLGKAFGFLPKRLGIGSGEYSYIISILSGYPTSAKVVCEGYSEGRITKRDAELLLILCSNGSAAFILSFIGGGIFSNNGAAAVLLLANYLSPIIAAFILSKSYPENGTTKFSAENSQKMSYISAFVSAVRDSAYSVLNVGAFIVFFSVVVGMSENIVGSNQLTKVLIAPLELSAGCKSIGNTLMPISLQIGLMGFLLGFGGVCVMFQNLSFIEKTDLEKGLFLKYKLLTGVINFVISYLLATMFAVSDVSVFNSNMQSGNFNSADVNLLLLCLLVIIILYTLIDKKMDSEKE